MKKVIKTSFQSSIIAIALIFLAGCASSPRFSSSGKDAGAGASATAEKSVEHRIEKQSKTLDYFQTRIIAESEKWLGTPYCWGGTSKKCADCSGFVQNVYKSIGIKLPRTAAEQYNYADKIDRNSARVGDLVFFSKNKRSISHVGVYVGDDSVIHASSSRGVVKQPLSNSYLAKNYAGIGRVLK